MSSSVWILAGFLALVRAQGGTNSGTTRVDAYTAVVPVNIRCSNDPNKGLTCVAGHSEQCREQWNFPNPCTPENRALKKTRFVHPFDRTKFLMCGVMGKLYVVQCPKQEAYYVKCDQCVGDTVALTASCEVPLVETPLVNNPCTRKTIIENKLFFPFPGNLNKFIHCDIWGKAWQRICTVGEVWSQLDVSCVKPDRLNPCARSTTDYAFLYRHPCDPLRYLRCDALGRAIEVVCANGLVFNEANQRCEAVASSTVGVLENICGVYQFGFVSSISSSWGSISGSGAVTFVETGNVAGTQETAAGAANSTMAATQGTVGGGATANISAFDILLSQWRDTVSATGRVDGVQGSVVGVGGTGGGVSTNSLISMGNAVGGRLVGTSIPVLDPAQLKAYAFSSVPYTEPCTADHLARGWLHFKMLRDPHSFLQCDMNGRMYIRPCSNNKQDWFDPYTTTCVDGPVHVDNIIHK